MSIRKLHARRCALTLVVIISTYGYSGRPQDAPPTPETPRTIRIVAYNIRHGRGMDDTVDLQRAAAVLTRLQPDLVALQEVDNGVARTAVVDQARTLGRLTGMQAVFGKFMDYQGGQYGMAILSKHPIVSSTNHMLPPGEEPRSALAARIRLAGSDRVVVLVGIHFYRTEAERSAQAVRLLQLLDHETAPVILAGDFNSTPDSDVMQVFADPWTIPDKGEDHYTFPATAPGREIDFILYRPDDAFRVIESRVVAETLASDHRPILLVLEMR